MQNSDQSWSSDKVVWKHFKSGCDKIEIKKWLMVVAIQQDKFGLYMV